MSKVSSGSDTTPRRKLLEVEDDEARQKRIQSLLENTDLQSSSLLSRSRAQPPPTFPTITSTPHAVPPSGLLSRAQAFLPLIAASNAELERVDPATLDIENIEGGGGAYIEMNLGLGVFEQRRPGSDDRDDDDTDSSEKGSDLADGTDSGSGSGSSSEDESDDSGSGSGSDVDQGQDATAEEQPTSKPSSKAPPIIEVLPDTGVRLERGGRSAT